MVANVVALTPAEIESRRADITDVYREAFSRPPYNKPELEVRLFDRALMDHVVRDDFCLVAALDQEPALLGFAYGYSCAAEQWWCTVVSEALPPRTRTRWLNDSFQFAEIAVRPDAQGRGIGGRLHDCLMGAVRHRRAVLSTLQANTAAFHLYRERGWVVLREHIEFPGIPRPYRIMGLDLSRDKVRRRSGRTVQ